MLLKQWRNLFPGDTRAANAVQKYNNRPGALVDTFMEFIWPLQPLMPDMIGDLHMNIV